MPKQSPWNKEAEEAVLSAAMMEPAALAMARAALSPESFFNAGHGKLFTALCEITDAGEVPDPMVLAIHLENRGDLKECGGKDYIGFLIDAVPTAANVAYHARIVRELADRRRLIAIGEQLAESARDMAVTPDLTAQAATSDLLPVAAHVRSKGFVPIGDVMVDVFEDIFRRRSAPEGLAGTTWGYDSIDEQTGGLRDGELVFFCGVPGSGKTATALNIAVRQAMKGNRVAIVSAEMGIRALVERIVINTCGLDSKRVRKGQIDDLEWQHMVNVGKGLKTLPILIDDTTQPRIQDIVAKCRALKAQHPDLKTIVVDFIQLLQTSDDENRSLELTQISYALKGLAKELEVGMIVTCQVDAAAVDKTEDKRPRLHHLRWSQGMREAADFICLIKNLLQYDQTGPSRLEMFWDKARELPVFVLYMRWAAQSMSVEEMPARKVA